MVVPCCQASIGMNYDLHEMARVRGCLYICSLCLIYCLQGLPFTSLILLAGMFMEAF